MTVVVDPYLLTIPSGDDVTAAIVDEYAQRLSAWSQVFRTDPDYIMSHAVVSKMCDLKLVPDYQNLRALFDKYELYEQSAYDIAEICRRILENYPDMEGRIAAEGIECQRESEEIIPEQVRARWHPEIAPLFSHALISTSYALNLLEYPDNWTLATAPLKESYTKIVASGNVRDNAASVFVTREWPLLFRPAEYIELIAYQEKIIKTYEKNPAEALSIAWKNIQQEVSSIGAIDQYVIRFGEGFVDSIKDKVVRERPYYKKDVERIFEGIVRALTDLWKFGGDKHHPLRKKIKDRTTDQKVRKRGEHVDSAGRIEIIGGNTPLHVHYWQCGARSYEISNVTDDHDDGTIYP